MLILTKRVPARVVMKATLWCNKNFLAMSPGYRAARAKCRSPMDSCFWCKHEFTDGEMMALACFVKKGNKVLCQDCADKLLASERTEK